MAIPVSQSDLKRFAVYGALAMEMAFSVLAGALFGYVLDAYFGTLPILTLVFLFLGFVAGVVTFIKLWELLRGKIQGDRVE